MATKDIKNVLVVGDLAGRYDELMKLVAQTVAQYPNQLDAVVSVGDIIDRGPKSKELLELFMAGEHDGVTYLAIKGNHEDMMVHECRRSIKYPHRCWYGNGGTVTADQFTEGKVPKNIIEWADSLPETLHLSSDGWPRDLLISHAPPHNGNPDPDAQLCGNFWHRGYKDDVEEVAGSLLLFGHNAHWGAGAFANDKQEVFAYNLDGSAGRRVVGIHWPSGTIFSQEYLP